MRRTLIFFTLLVLIPFSAFSAPLRTDKPIADAITAVGAATFQVSTGVKTGTAVLLKFDENRKIAYVATALHILETSLRLNLFDRWGKRVDVEGKTEVYFEREQDVAILKIELAPSASPTSANTTTSNIPFVKAVALGYPDVLNQLSALPVHLNNITKAYPYISKQDTDFYVRFFRERGSAGFSGGPLVTETGEVAGLVLGELESQDTGIMVPIKYHLEAMAKGVFKRYQPSDFQNLFLPFQVVKHATNGASFQDVLHWSDFSTWIRLFDDPMSFHESFQEVSLNLYRLLEDRRMAGSAADPKDLTLHVDDASFPDHRGRVSIWLNGAQYEMDSAGSWPIGEHLVSGENLLIVNKTINGPADLFSISPLKVQVGPTTGLPLLQIERSLPAIVRGYAVYVTLQMAPPETDLGAYDARLAVRGDLLEQIANQLPLKYSLDLLDAWTGSYGKGSLFLASGSLKDEAKKFIPGVNATEGRFVTLRPSSPQTLELLFEGRTEILEFALRFFGIKLDSKKPQSFPFLIKGKLQWVRDNQSRFYWVTRAVGSYTPRGNFSLLPDSGLDLDISGLLQELLLSWINNTKLHPSSPVALTSDSIRDLLKTAGMEKLVGEKALAPKRIFFHQQGDRTWLVLTFQTKEHPSTPPELLPASGSSYWIEFAGRGMPASLTTALAESSTGWNSLLQKAQGIGKSVEAITLRFSPPNSLPVPQKLPIAISRGSDLGDPLHRAVVAVLGKAKPSAEIDLEQNSLLPMLEQALPGLTLTFPKHPSVAKLVLNNGGFSVSDAITFKEGEARAGEVLFRGITLVLQSFSSSGLEGGIVASEMKVGSEPRVRDVSINIKATPTLEGWNIALSDLKGTILYRDVQVPVTGTAGSLSIKAGRLSGCSIPLSLAKTAGTLTVGIAGGRPQFKAKLELLQIPGARPIIESWFSQALDWARIGSQSSVKAERLWIDTDTGDVQAQAAVHWEQVVTYDVPRIIWHGIDSQIVTDRETQTVDVTNTVNFSYNIYNNKADGSVIVGNLLPVPLSNLLRFFDLKSLLGDQLGL